MIASFEGSFAASPCAAEYPYAMFSRTVKPKSTRLPPTEWCKEMVYMIPKGGTKEGSTWAVSINGFVLG
jgi:hypothetical protein